MKLPYTLYSDFGHPKGRALSSHKTLINAKRAIRARLNQWSKAMRGQPFCYAYKVEHKGKMVYSVGGWR